MQGELDLFAPVEVVEDSNKNLPPDTQFDLSVEHLNYFYYLHLKILKANEVSNSVISRDFSCTGHTL